jgi:hypothetical protein
MVAALLIVSACARADTSYAYVPCATSAECMGRASCEPIVWRDGSGNLCTASCAGESSCPHSGRCLDVNASGVFLCYEPCALDADCPTHFICQPITTSGAVCLPM